MTNIPHPPQKKIHERFAAVTILGLFYNSEQLSWDLSAERKVNVLFFTSL